MTTVFITGGEAPPPDWCSSQEQEEEWGWGGLRNWISVWCRQKWKSLTAGGLYCLIGTIYFKGDSKVYLLQKCKSLAGDFKFHVKCCWNRCKNFTMGMGKKPQKLILLKLEKHHCRWNNWRWCIYFLLYYLTWHGI